MPRDSRSPGGVMDDPHDARSEHEYMETEMVMKTSSLRSRRKSDGKL